MSRAWSGRWAQAIVRQTGDRFLRTVAGFGSLTMAEIALGLTAAIVLARVLGVGGLGVYSVALATVNLAAIPVELGLASLVMREIAHAGEKRATDSATRGILRFAIGLALITSCIAILAVLTVAGAVPGLPDDGEILWFAVWLIPLTTLGRIIGGALAGRQYLITGHLPERLVRPGVFAAGLLAVALVAPAWLTPDRAVGLHVAGASVALLYGGFRFWGQFGPVLWRGKADYALRHWTWSALRLGLATGLHAAHANLLVMLTGALGGAESAGLLRVAQRTGDLIAIGIGVSHITAGPRIARLNAAGDQNGLRVVLRQSALVGSGTTTALLCLFAVTGHWLLSTVFGSDFGAAYPAVLIIALGEMVRGTMGAGIILLNMTRREGHSVIGFTIAIAVTLIVAAVLTPIYGVSGAAWGMCTGTAAVAVYTWWQVRRLQGLDASLLGLAPTAPVAPGR